MLTGDFFKKIIITKDAPAPYYNNDGMLVRWDVCNGIFQKDGKEIKIKNEACLNYL